MKKSQNSSQVLAQLDTFLDEQFDRVCQRFTQESEKKEAAKNHEWIKDFATQYIKSRSSRAQELSTAELKAAQELAREYIGKGQHDFFATCVDGRNMPSVMFSRPPHVGGVLRSPAGVVSGFMEGQKPGEVFIDRKSEVVQQIIKLLTEKSEDTIFYGLDSHIGCAARGLIHSTEGGKQKDSGLRSDVKSKMMMAKGIIALRKSLVDQGIKAAEVIPTFFSYDPHDGGIVAGLELHVDNAQVAQEGYTAEVIEKLVTENKIIRTLDLFEDSEILAELEKVIAPKTADFRNNFAETLKRNWQALTTLYNNGEGQAYKTVYAKLHQVYQNSDWTIGSKDSLSERHISERTLKQKAKFLLKNLLTRYSIAGVSHVWPYDKHQEDLVVITDGGYAPFSSLDAFSVFSRDLDALIPNAKLPIDLIRQFRRAASIKNPVAKPELSAEEFSAAPVLVSDKAIFRITDEKAWAELTKLDFTKVFGAINWDNPKTLRWQRTEIEELLKQTTKEQPVELSMQLSLSFVDVVFELFNRMRIMMKDKYFRQMILHGRIVVIHTVVDADRNPRLVLPFVA